MHTSAQVEGKGSQGGDDVCFRKGAGMGMKETPGKLQGGPNNSGSIVGGIGGKT